jgi:hypothetical protein
LGKTGDRGNTSAFENTAKQMRTAALDRSNDEERLSTPEKGRCFTDEEIEASLEREQTRSRQFHVHFLAFAAQ